MRLELSWLRNVSETMYHDISANSIVLTCFAVVSLAALVVNQLLPIEFPVL